MVLKLLFLLLFLPNVCFAAFQTYVGTGTSKITTTGTKAYTGVGFTPTAIIFFSTSVQTAEDYILNTNAGAQSYGITDGTNSRTIGWAGQARTSSNEAAHSINAATCIRLGRKTNGANTWTTLAEASLSSLDADGFTLNWTTVNGANAEIFGFIAIGGVTAYVGTITEGATTGNYSTTDPNFQPTFAMFLYTGDTAATTASTVKGGLGFATATEEAVTYHVCTTGASDMIINNVLRTTSMMEITNAGSSTIISDSDFVSFDATGFTLNRTTDDGTDRIIYYLVIDGVQADIASFTQAAATGNQATTGVGFQPSLTMFLTHGAATAFEANMTQESFGAGTSSSQRAFAANAYQDNGYEDQDTAIATKSTSILLVGDPTTPTNQGEADLVSLDSDGFTVNWTTTDATARLCLGISLAATGGAPAARRLIMVSEE